MIVSLVLSFSLFNPFLLSRFLLLLPSLEFFDPHRARSLHLLRLFPAALTIFEQVLYEKLDSVGYLRDTRILQEVLKALKDLGDLIGCLQFPFLERLCFCRCSLFLHNGVKLIVEKITDLLHQFDCAFNGVICDAIDVSLETQKLFEDINDYGLEEKISSEKLADKPYAVKEMKLELVKFILIFDPHYLFGVIREELIKARFAIINQEKP